MNYITATANDAEALKTELNVKVREGYKLISIVHDGQNFIVVFSREY
jgi:hypothetical protein